MNIRTIEFTDPHNNDFSIRVYPVDTTDRVKRKTEPYGFWFHFDVDEYSLEEAKTLLVSSYMNHCEDRMQYWRTQLDNLKEAL